MNAAAASDAGPIALQSPNSYLTRPYDQEADQ
jgi:hypothetical protein